MDSFFKITYLNLIFVKYKKYKNMKYKNMKYFSLIPAGGFNDILSQIYFSIEYCIKFKRILLINTVNTDYHINFSDYFTINLPNK